MSQEPVGAAIRDDQHLVDLWISGRPETTKRVYVGEAQSFLSSLTGGLRDASPADVVTYFSNL
ncbi:MAG: hypothetical protein IPI67_37185 [Myxococcales bacterium]|nr:hypothetical protein [Myxococcales bacterium]